MKTSKRNIIIGFFVLFIIQIVTGNLSVYNYLQLQQLHFKLNQKLKNVSFSLANFGQVPYGKSLIGEVLTSPNESNECQFQHLDDSSNQTDYQQSSLDFQKKFMLVQRGSCNFVYKAINAQKLGAKALIVMDNQFQNFRIIMADNGYGYKVKIPAIFIKKEDGDFIKSLIQQVKLFNINLNETQNKKRQKVQLNIQFPGKKTDKVNLTLFLQDNNRFSYKLIKKFQPFYNQIKHKINLDLVYNVQSCPMIELFNDQQMCKLDCVSNGKYCVFNAIHDQSAGGKMVVQQQLLQYSAFLKDQQKWFILMDKIDDQCQKISQLQQCSKKIISEVYDDTKIIVENAYSSYDKTTGVNPYLENFLKKIQLSGVVKFPSASVNGFLVKGTLTAEFLMSDICNNLLQPPGSCYPYVDFTPPDFPWGIVVFIIVFCSIFFTIAFIIYRRMVRKRIKQQMSGKVNDMVSKYIEFYSERNNR